MRTTTATINGRTYQIPDLWLAGFVRRGGTTLDGIRYWHEQQLLAEQFADERSAEYEYRRTLVEASR